MASEESILKAPIPSVKAICIRNDDPWRQNDCEELHIGKVYTPDYFVIGRSWSYLCISEHPGSKYNTVMFDYQEGEGHRIDFSKDIIRPIMERYREYLWNEMILTGTWKVYLKLNDIPTNTVPDKDKYRILRYGSFEIEETRKGPQDA